MWRLRGRLSSGIGLGCDERSPLPHHLAKAREID